MTAADATTLTRTTATTAAPTLTRVGARAWTTRWSAAPGATLLLARSTQLTLVDHGLTTEAAEQLLVEVTSADPRLRLESVVWTRWDRGLADRVPEHVDTFGAAGIAEGDSVPLPGLHQVRAHRVGDHQVLVWDAAEQVLLGGDLLAPGVPELSAITPAQATETLLWAARLAPAALVGTHGHIVLGAEQTVRALRSRLSYLRVLRALAAEAVRFHMSPRQAAFSGWQDGRLRAWQSVPARHLVNLHAALAEARCRPLNLERALADAREVAEFRPCPT